MTSHQPFAIAALYERHSDGDTFFESFSILTINAYKHAVMSHFHRPCDEKRMPVIVLPSRYREWLTATNATAAAFFVPYPAEDMIAQPEPLPSRKSMAKPQAKATLDSKPRVSKLL